MNRLGRSRWTRRMAAGAALAAVIAVVSGCGGTAAPTSTNTTGKGPVNIAVCAAYTGGVITYGIPWLQGVQVAAANINSHGGVMGRKVSLHQCDTKGDPVDAVPALQQVLSAQKISAEVGLAALDWQDALPILNKDHIVSFTHIGSPAIDHLSMPYSFSTGPSDAVLGAAMAYYAYSKGYKRVALAFDATSSSQTLVPGIKVAAKRLHMTIVANPALPVGAASYQAEVEQVVGGHPQAILTQVEPNTAGTFFSELQSLGGSAIPIVASDLTLEPSWVKAVGASYYESHVVSIEAATNTTSTSYSLFISGYHAQFGSAEPNYLSVYSYDGMNIAALAMVAAHSTDPTVFYKHVLSVTQAGSGKHLVYDFAQGAALLAKGEQIKYVGVGSPDVYNTYHRVSTGFAVERATPSGAITRLSLIPATKLDGLF